MQFPSAPFFELLADYSFLLHTAFRNTSLPAALVFSAQNPKGAKGLIGSFLTFLQAVPLYQATLPRFPSLLPNHVLSCSSPVSMGANTSNQSLCAQVSAQMGGRTAFVPCWHTSCMDVAKPSYFGEKASFGAELEFLEVPLIILEREILTVFFRRSAYEWHKNSQFFF